MMFPIPSYDDVYKKKINSILWYAETRVVLLPIYFLFSGLNLNCVWILCDKQLLFLSVGIEIGCHCHLTQFSNSFWSRKRLWIIAKRIKIVSFRLITELNICSLNLMLFYLSQNIMQNSVCNHYTLSHQCELRWTILITYL